MIASDTTATVDGFFFSHIIMGGEAVRSLCFRKFKIPLVHLSFCFVKETGKDWKSAGNLDGVMVESRW